jgi:hypothetical protein
VSVPTNESFNFVVQDNKGFRANVRFNGFNGDISSDSGTLAGIYDQVAAVITALAAATSAKVVKAGYSFDFDYAQEPTTDTGLYPLVIQKAHLKGGDGAGGFMSVDIPAPVAGMFYPAGSGQDSLVVVNPASTNLTNLLTAVSGSLTTPRGGDVFSQFFGGQLVEGKARRRRVLQGF